MHQTCRGFVGWSNLPYAGYVLPVNSPFFEYQDISSVTVTSIPWLESWNQHFDWTGYQGLAGHLLVDGTLDATGTAFLAFEHGICRKRHNQKCME